MTIVTLEEAQAHLAEIVGRLGRGEEVRLTRDGLVVARLVGESPAPAQRPGPGLAKGMLTIVAEDDEHLEHFAEYMP